LPEHGTNIKGHRRAQQELLAASGYARRPREFGDLLGILDTELRLITPTESEEIEEGASRERQRPVESAGAVPVADAPGSPGTTHYYQLTHDYLVPALRQWLTRKQRETRRGRAELRLAERTSLWSTRPQSRYLPAWWEWANILLFTRQKSWKVPERQMMHTATRKYLLQAGALIILLALTVWAVRAVMEGPVKAAGLVDQLASAEIKEVPEILEKLSTCQRWATPQLRAMIDRYPESSKEHLRASLALLPVDPKQTDYLHDRLLEAETITEFGVIRDALWLHTNEERIQQLWDLMEDQDPERRLRAAGALALFDPKSPRWAKYIDELALTLARKDGQWSQIVMPNRESIANSLVKIARDPARPESERSQVTGLYMRYLTLSDRPRRFSDAQFDFFLDFDGQQYDQVLPFAMAKSGVVPGMKQVMARSPRPEWSEQEQDRLARQQANAAVFLLQLDQADEHVAPHDLKHGEELWPRLRQGSDPRVRAYLLHRLGHAGIYPGINPSTLFQQFELEPDVVARRALLLSLGGEFGDRKLPASQRAEWASKLRAVYREDPDPGIHAAIDWLLRLPAWNQGDRLREIDEQLAGQTPQNPGRWFVNKQGQTLVVFPDQVEFVMGSPTTEPGRQADETVQRVRIPRSFALASKEVTLKQFREFLQAPPGVRPGGVSTTALGPDENGPVLGVTWFEAAQYCRWLSEREDIPEEEMCYPPISDIKPGMQMPADYLSRTGYRLPTEAEWEYACRAGVATSRPYGTAEDLLVNYAWFMGNASGRAWPVGSKKPNEYGLFDMYGNAAEWCQDAARAAAPGEAGRIREDREVPGAITAAVKRVQRGGSFCSPAAQLRSAARSAWQPEVDFAFAGLRVAKTCP
jgi:formylglycine-generating enzyme required for sulfatase activity